MAGLDVGGVGRLGPAAVQSGARVRARLLAHAAPECLALLGLLAREAQVQVPARARGSGLCSPRQSSQRIKPGLEWHPARTDRPQEKARIFVREELITQQPLQLVLVPGATGFARQLGLRVHGCDDRLVIGVEETAHACHPQAPSLTCIIFRALSNTGWGF